jgi:predicted PhzF superfamily epimerase YddE/YHI9
MIQSYIVDAFTSKPFRGNQAAVCLLEKPIDDSLMQSIAAEFNLSETSFLFPLAEGIWSLRWFTPICEVNLCGHATLAAAHVLLNECEVTLDLLRFQTRSGELSAKFVDQKIELDFPLTPTNQINKTDFFHSVDPNFVSLHQAGEDFLLELATENQVRSYQPNLSAIKQLDCRGLIVTAPGNGYDCHFVSRFFAPRFGIDEDPVTGSAHCALVDFWNKKTGRTHFIAKQISKRGGTLDVELKENRVALRGNSVTTANVQLRIG